MTTIRIFIAGEYGGKIAIGNGLPSLFPEDGIGDAPAGTCGIRWHNPDTWFWATHDGSQLVNTLPRMSTHGLGEGGFIQFAGPYSGCNGDSYVFLFPLLESGEPPFEIANTLVVQGDDFAFLDANEAVIPFGENPDLPERQDIPSLEELCEDAPELCERPEDLTIDDPIIGPKNTTRDLHLTLVRSQDMITSLNAYLAIGNALLRLGPKGAAVNRRIVDSLTQARQRLEIACRLIEQADAQRLQLLDTLKPVAQHRFTRWTLGNISLSVGLSKIHLEQSTAQLDVALEALKRGPISTERNYAPLMRSGRLLGEAIELARRENDHLQAWAFALEAR